uniref:ETS domain-containing protein n=1 Tax=Parascaris univalens TaxID=6257 RepID=A0A915CAA8_PARUN
MLTNGGTLEDYRWNSLSPSPLSENDEEEEYCRAIKIEHPFEVDDESFFRSSPSSDVTHQMQKRATPCTAIPIASCATAAASLSSAFCKRSNGFTKSGSLASENVFEDSSPISTPLSIVKAEQTQQSEDCSRPIESSLTNSSVTSCSDAAQMDIYRDLILRHLIQDISTTCSKLALPTDPYVWTAEHSGRWISDMCMQFQLPPPRELFLAGRVLLAMSQEEFMARAPEGGDTLHAQLQLWKTGSCIHALEYLLIGRLVC